MKKIIALAIPFIVLITVGVTLAQFEEQRTPDWEVELNQYLSQNRSPTGSIKVQAVVSAKRPWNFTADMGTPVSSDWPWGIEKLPFPPSSVQCVLLEEKHSSTNTASNQQIIFVAYHSDSLWRQGWLVHAGPSSFTPEVFAHLASIGCDLAPG